MLGDKAAYLALCASHQEIAMAKHIPVIHHFPTKQVQVGNIAVQYIASASNVADILAKALFKPLLEKHRASLGLKALKD